MTRVLIAFCGVFGLLVPAWTLSKTPDLLAQGLIVLISMGLLAGIAELFSRAQRTQRLQGELHFLDENEGNIRATLQKLDPLLAKLVRSLLAGRPAQVSNATFAAYLITALAMVGLLGTFLGMVDALAGARDALRVTREIDDLRQSLLAPMDGLSRAFGTSVAGVWSSALLGLAASILRRAEGRFVTELNAHFTAYFSDQTLAGRQLIALERIGDQGDALPRAVAGLVEITDQLPALQRMLQESHKETNGALKDAVDEAAQDVRKSMATALNETQRAQEKQLDLVMSHAGKTLQGHLENWSEHLQRNVQRQDEQEEKRLFKMQATFQKALDQYEAVLQRRADEFSEKLVNAAQTQVEQQKNLLENEKTRQNAWAAQQEKQISLHQERDESIQNLLQQAAELSERSTKETAAQGERMEALSQEVKEALSLQTDKSAALLAELAEKVSELAATHQLHLDNMKDESEKSLQRLSHGAQADLKKHLEVLSDAGASRLQGVHAAQEKLGQNLALLVDKLPNQLKEFKESWLLDREKSQALFDEKGAALMQEMLLVQQTQVSDVEEKAQARIEEFAASLNENLQKNMAEQAESFAIRQAELSQFLQRVKDSESARQVLLDDLIKQTQAQNENLSQETLRFLSSVTEVQNERENSIMYQMKTLVEAQVVQQEMQMQTWLQTLKEQTELRMNNEQAQQEKILTGLIEEAKVLAEASSIEKEYHREALLTLQKQLDEERTLQSTLFAEQLAAYADSFCAKNKANEEVIEQAMTSLLTGSVDLAATAERFSDAVDVFRSAKEQLSLPMGQAVQTTSISGASIGKTGPEEQFGGYLEHTKDLFDTSLQLQRALFEEIQALREGQA